MAEDNVSRRSVLAGAAGSAVLAAGLKKSHAQTMPQPNILFIMADDMGYADVSCYGRRDFETPNIDGIAANGVRFTQGYANSSVCSATRTALMTGRYQYRLPVGLEEPLPSNRPDLGLPPDHPTLPSILKQAGYATALIGKWHLGLLPNFDPLKSGYDRFYGHRGGAIDYFSHVDTDHRPDFWDGNAAIEETGYATKLFGQRAVETVNEFASMDRPFFLSLHFNAPHWPWETIDDEEESERLRTASLAHFDGGTQRTYRRMIQTMDAEIGRVLQALDENGLSENTIVIFTSDNGGERFADTWPFTGRKKELLEGGLSVPLIVSWPERIPRNVTSDQVTITMDWMPTLLEAAGASPHPEYPSEGMNLLPVLTEGAAISSRKLYWRYKGLSQQALRDGDFKYLKIRNNSFLFNVVEDPMERANLKNRRRDIYDRLVADWNAWNKTMLPTDPQNYSHPTTGAQLADRYGIE
jgi:arylsulfatase A-like enzyme